MHVRKYIHTLHLGFYTHTTIARPRSKIVDDKLSLIPKV